MSPEIRRRLLVFDLADQCYGLPLEQVQEVAFMASLTQPAGRPPILYGFLRLGRVSVGVLDVRRLFALPPQIPGLYTPLIVLRSAPLALMVDRVASQGSVAESDWEPVEPTQAVNGCIQALAQVGGRRVPVLDARRLLLQQEHRCLAELLDMEQQRLSALP